MRFNPVKFLVVKKNSSIEKILAKIFLLFTNPLTPIKPIIIIFKIFNKAVLVYSYSEFIVSDKVEGQNCWVIKRFKATEFINSVLWYRSFWLEPYIKLVNNFAIAYRILNQVEIIGNFFDDENSLNTVFDDSCTVEMICANNVYRTITVLDDKISSL